MKSKIKVISVQGDIQELSPCDFIPNQWYMKRSAAPASRFACAQQKPGCEVNYVVFEHGHFDVQRNNTGEKEDWIPVEVEMIFTMGTSLGKGIPHA